ncbi:MAG: DUF4180 domain-containing protein [Clostridiaceae bacterium]|nr:DUF4180 domain-containing protein [Clostridiaceae bacterium]
MTYKIVGKDQNIALIETDVVIVNVQSALDFIASVNYETRCDRIILNKSVFTESFFVLSTGLAGEVLQKFVNYHMKAAIIGDYSRYTSKPLKDFIYESNKGKDIFFVASEEEGIKKLETAE